jgi:hypothetical protein
LSEPLASKSTQELREIAEAATAKEWRWQDSYDFREHLEHREQGLEADCPNLYGVGDRDWKGENDTRMELVDAEGNAILRDWGATDDGGVEIAKPDAEFIQTFNPATVLALLDELESYRNRHG